jgi:hypothetical protein
MATGPFIAIAIFVVIIVIAGFSCLVIPPGKFDQTRLKTFVTVFAGFSLLATIMFYYLLIRLQVIQGDLLSLRETQEVQSTMHQVVEKIKKSSKIVPSFCAKLIPLQFKGKVKREKTSDHLERAVEKHDLSTSIFGAFQTAVLEYKFVSEQEDFYNCTFLQWATSKSLRKYWTLSKISLIPKTQTFGDLLFEYAPKTNVHDVESYEKACHALKNDPRYKCIFEK